MRFFKGPLLIANLCAALVLIGPTHTCFAMGSSSMSERSKPIENPFGDFSPDVNGVSQPIILRSKTSGRSVEVVLPQPDHDTSDVILPFTNVTGDSRAPASTHGGSDVDQSYSEKKYGFTDREILASLPKTLSAADEAKRTELEKELGLKPGDMDTPEGESSYLASVDRIKQLYRLGRYEPGLIEIDSLLRMYPTNPKLYEMRGTLLDRLGYAELALKAWQEALELRPENATLRRFIERKRKVRERNIAGSSR